MTAENHVDAVEPPPLSIASDPRSEKNNEAEDANGGSVPTRESEEKGRLAQLLDNEVSRKVWAIISWTPKRCRWDPEDPPKFSLALNLLFAFVSLPSLYESPRRFCLRMALHLNNLCFLAVDEIRYAMP